MYTGRNGQTQVLTAVLLGGILVAGVSAAYIWGLPILQKNQDVTNAEQSLSDLQKVSRGISEVATGSGSRTVTVRLGDGTLDIDTDQDMITYRTITKGAYVSTNLWVPLNENDMQGMNRSTGLPSDGHGIRGVDEPVLLIGKAEKTTNGYSTTYRAATRPLLDTSTDQTYVIDLVQDGNLQASNGEKTVVLSSGRERTETGEGVNGGTRTVQEILVKVS